VNHFRFHIGDYLKDTTHLSLLEHGVYLRLIQVYYTREAPIPEDQAARLIGARSQDERDALAVVLKEFFQVVDGNCHQNRCQAEIDEWHRLSAEQAAKGRAGAAKRWNGAKDGNGHDRQMALANISHGNGYPPAINPDGRTMASQLPTPNSQLPDSQEGAHAPDSKLLKSGGRDRKGTRISDDFTLTPERRAIAEGEGIDPLRTFDKFCDYWRGASGSRATKLDWDATWRNWCRNEGDRKPQQQKGGAERGLPRFNPDQPH
jgi:uncharacterized protein YdaU (DUF1376 family)